METYTTDQYQTIGDKEYQAEIKVKGSRFIAIVKYTPTRESAEEFYKEIKKRNYDATHNCFAYRISEDDYRYSDDGEPSGTAGLPIYKVLKNDNIYKSIIIVTRYFGGTKLGTGGLARAYSDAASAGLQNCKKITKTHYITIGLELSYEKYNELQRMVNQFNGKFEELNYGAKITLNIKIPKSRFSMFQQEFEQKFFDKEEVKLI